MNIENLTFKHLNFLGITLVISWYLIKLLCKKKGYPFTVIFHFMDFINLIRIIKNEKIEFLKFFYIMIFIIFSFMFMITLILLLALTIK